MRPEIEVKGIFMIDTVIFDVGKVLIGFDWQGYMKNLFGDETIEAINNAIWQKCLWIEFDKGIMKEDEILSAIIEGAPDYEKEIRICFNRLGECIERKDYAIPWIDLLKSEGYRVLYLSNYSNMLIRANPAALDFIPHMDGGIFSYKVQLIKPDKEIFELLLEEYGLDREKCLFIDDNSYNVSAAKELGFKTCLFTEYEESFKEVSEILAKEQGAALCKME